MPLSPILPRSVTAGSIGTRAADVRQRLRVQGGAFVGKAAEDDAGYRWCRGQRVDRCRDRDPRRARGRKTVDTGGNGGKGNRAKAVALAKFDGAAVARRQQLIFVLIAAVPDRAYGMNHMPRR